MSDSVDGRVARGLRTRIEALVTRRAELYEQIAPIRRAMERTGVTPVLEEGRRGLDRILRSQRWSVLQTRRIVGESFTALLSR